MISDPTGTSRWLMGSRAWISKLFADIRASYWFLPTLCVGLAHLLAMLTLWLDRQHPQLTESLPTVFSETRIEGARGLLTLMASSVIGVTGVMFSMTMVAVSFASGNFGPRLVGNFMRDRGTQMSLGILIATFAFCLQILRSVHGSESGDGFVPLLSLNAALTLTMVCVLVMIYFVHHVPETINVSNITASLGHRLEACIRAEIERNDREEPAVPMPAGAPLAQPCLDRSGYVQSLDVGRLRAFGSEHGWRILLRAQPGDFVAASAPVVEVCAGDSDTPPNDTECQALQACFALGDKRTEDQDLTFLVDQLVEMTARALSPGVNDPFTARDCLDRMYAALDVALNWKGGLVSGEQGEMGQRRLTFLALLKQSFQASLPYVLGDRMAQSHMGELVARLRPSARNEDEARALETLAEQLDFSDFD